MDLDPSTSPVIKDEHGGRYPDLILPRGSLSSGLSQGAEAESTTTTAPIVPLQPPMVASSRSRRCNYCNESSTGGFGSCSCQGSRGGDEGFSNSNIPSREKNSSRDDVTVKMHSDTRNNSKFVKSFQGSEKLSNDEDIKYGRKWEYFPGKNKFYFDGRLMTAPSIRFCMLSFFLILLTFILFTAFDGPFLAERLTIAIPIIGSILFVLVIVNMIKTSCSDPGILPRASAQESEFIEKSYANPNGLRPPPRTKDIIVNGQTIKSKYCFTCKMFRPPRASHCGVCDNCVDRFDHHCPFLGNCIGKRNYRNFYTFVVSLSLLAVFVLCCSITKLALLGKEKGNFLDALRDSPTSAIVILISFFGMWTVIGLAGFHTYLIAVEQTTNEDCGEGSNTPRSGGVDISGTQTMYQITALESGEHKLGSGNTTTPIGTGNPIGSNKVFTSANQVAVSSGRPLGSHYPKAGTVPGKFRSLSFQHDQGCEHEHDHEHEHPQRKKLSSKSSTDATLAHHKYDKAHSVVDIHLLKNFEKRQSKHLLCEDTDRNPHNAIYAHGEMNSKIDRKLSSPVLPTHQENPLIDTNTTPTRKSQSVTNFRNFSSQHHHNQQYVPKSGNNNRVIRPTMKSNSFIVYEINKVSKSSVITTSGLPANKKSHATNPSCKSDRHHHHDRRGSGGAGILPYDLATVKISIRKNEKSRKRHSIDILDDTKTLSKSNSKGSRHSVKIDAGDNSENSV